MRKCFDFIERATYRPMLDRQAISRYSFAISTYTKFVHPDGKKFDHP